jgi:hypothetical protein
MKEDNAIISLYIAKSRTFLKTSRLSIPLCENIRISKIVAGDLNVGLTMLNVFDTAPV